MIVGSSFVCGNSKPILKPQENLITFLQSQNLWSNQPPRIHLGCGEQHFDGYINIDYPSSEHTVQSRVGADVFANISALYLPTESIREIRNHHMFEHFDRQRALALLCSWANALIVGGELHIETPDFEAGIALWQQISDYHSRQIILRHLYGSHEAHWTYHYDGWYPEKFRRVFEALGLDIVRIETPRNGIITNVVVHARKNGPLSLDQLAAASKNILRQSMVGAGDELMWNEWCRQFDVALSQLFPAPGQEN